MTELVLDGTRSRVTIHTFAEGLLARLAHDLELVCGELSGTATTREAEAGKASGTASISAPLSGITVGGVLGKDGRVDAHGLATSEQRDVLEKMRDEVFHAEAPGLVRVETEADGRGSARIRIVAPNGRASTASVRPTLESSADGLRARGSFEVALSELGSDPIKGPMGAFRVKDRVKVAFDVVFVPRAT